MHISVVPKTKLSSFIATPNNEVSRRCIVQEDQAPVFDCQDLLRPHRLLAFSQALSLDKLREVDLCRFTGPDDLFIDHERVFGTLTKIVPAPDISAASASRGDRMRLANRKLHKRSLMHHIIFVELHELRGPRGRVHLTQVNDYVLVHNSVEQENFLHRVRGLLLD